MLRSALVVCLKAALLKFMGQNLQNHLNPTSDEAEAQRKGYLRLLMPIKADPIYAAKLGVNVDDLIVSQPDTGEQAWRWPICWYAREPLMSWWWTP